MEIALKLLEIERQLVVDRERDTLSVIKPVDGMGWLNARQRLEVAELQLRQAKERRQLYGFVDSDTKQK